jgi:hypothetical protein
MPCAAGPTHRASAAHLERAKIGYTEAHLSYLRFRLVPQEILEPMDIVLAVLHI